MTLRITDFRTRYGSCAICVPFINCHSGRTRFAQTCPSVAVTDTDLTTEPHLPSWNLLFFVSCQRLSQKSFPTFYTFPSCTVLYRVSGVPPRHPNRGTVLCGAVQGNGKHCNCTAWKDIRCQNWANACADSVNEMQASAVTEDHVWAKRVRSEWQQISACIELGIKHYLRNLASDILHKRKLRHAIVWYRIQAWTCEIWHRIFYTSVNSVTTLFISNTSVNYKKSLFPLASLHS